MYHRDSNEAQIMAEKAKVVEVRKECQKFELQVDELNFKVLQLEAKLKLVEEKEKLSVEIVPKLKSSIAELGKKYGESQDRVEELEITIVSLNKQIDRYSGKNRSAKDHVQRIMDLET